MTEPPGNGDRIPELVTLWWLMAGSSQPLSLPDQVAAWIGERILSGSIAPGSRVTEQAVSAEFNISRAPVREAFRILERQRLIDIHPRKGARAAPLTQQAVRDIAEIRVALYGVIARRLAGTGNATAIAKLESKAQDLLAFAQDERGPDRYLWGALELSLVMAQESGNAQITEVLRGLAMQTYRYARHSAATTPHRQRTARLWRDAVRSMKRLDGEGAAQGLTRIAEFARDEALRVLQEHPELTDPES